MLTLCRLLLSIALISVDYNKQKEKRLTLHVHQIMELEFMNLQNSSYALSGVIYRKHLHQSKVIIIIWQQR